MPRAIPDDIFDLDQQLATITDVMVLMTAALRIADDAGVDDAEAKRHVMRETKTLLRRLLPPLMDALSTERKNA